MKPILCVVGTRPNYMKMAPILRALDAHVPPLPYVLVHTGQHYDPAMERVFFEALGMPTPSHNLAVGAGSHAAQTGEIMKRLDPVIEAHAPGAVLVVGDVNSTLAAALVAAKRGLPVVHVEAGLRSRDRGMPEEINRILVDQLSDLLLTTEARAADNLAAEGIGAERVAFVGNTMIDTLETFRDRCTPATRTLAEHGVARLDAWAPAGYALVTLHRPSNVDDPATLSDLVGTLEQIAADVPIVFPVHPRTRGNLERFGLLERLSDRWLITPPLGYLEMLGLMRDARVVLTDSGGVQEETTVLGVPCLTLRRNTERPVTVSEGTNQLVGIQRDAILAAWRGLREGGSRHAGKPALWDGRSAERIAATLWERRAALGLA